MMYHPILCIDGNRAINVSPMSNADDLFKHCYELMQIEAPRIQAFKMYYDQRDPRIIMVDTIMMLRSKLSKPNSPAKYQYYMDMSIETLTKFVDMYHALMSSKYN
jgi:hypothetical protein